jgi:hypothetical protein
MTESQETRLEFKIGEVFPDRDEVARYVMRLSMALGDLRIAGEYSVRNDQPHHERLYFIRLFAAHMREAVLLLDPPDRGVVPSVEDFIAALPADSREFHAEPLRKALEEVLRLLRRQFSMRPGVNLRHELRRMRNQFFHYHADRNSDADLGDAMAAAAHEDGAYVIGEDPRNRFTMRAEYADTVSTHITFPFEGDDATVRPVAEELLEDILNLLGPLTDYLHHVETAYLRSRPPGVVTLVEPDGARSEARRPPDPDGESGARHRR